MITITGLSVGRIVINPGQFQSKYSVIPIPELESSNVKVMVSESEAVPGEIGRTMCWDRNHCNVAGIRMKNVSWNQKCWIWL